MSRPLNVLFLCTGNSARSIMAEAYLNHVGGGRFRAFSAGSSPAGRVNPHAIATLRAADIEPGPARSKSWSEFARSGAPKMDLIVAVCDSAAGEVCPIWPGHPATAHWGLPDPAAAGEAEAGLAFETVFRTIRKLIDKLAREPEEALGPARAKETLARIARETLG